METTAHNRGFTLLELMATLAVGVIVMVIAIPSYHGMVSRSALAAAVNDLVGDLNYARSEAVVRGGEVYLCASVDQATCREEIRNWSDGWIVYALDPDSAGVSPVAGTLLRVHGDGSRNVTLSVNGTPPLRFNSSGYAMTGWTFLASNIHNPAVRKIIVSFSGRVRTTGE